jgi:hypothetical protein
MADFKTAAVSLSDSPNLDAFSRLRVSMSHSQFDSQLTYDLQPLLWEQITAGTGATIAHDTTNRCATLAFASTATGGVCKMQTFEHFRYTSGKSQLIFQTFNFVEGVADCLKFAGYSDGTNGIEIQLSGVSGVQFMLRSVTTTGDELATQASWNLDKLDGTGSSGITLDLTRTQILVIDFQALYVGRVRVGFDFGGQIVYAHEFNHANINTHPYIQTANLPLVAGMTCTGTVSTTMQAVCATVIQEDGPGNSEGYHFSVSSPVVTAASGARTHILSIQPKTTFNSVPNRSKFVLESVEVMASGNQPVQWELCLGDVLTGTTTFTDVNTAYSAFQSNTAGTTSGAPAIVVGSGYATASAQAKGDSRGTVPFKYPICLNAAGAVRDMARLTLLVTGLGGSSTCYATINWKEIR